MQPMAILNSAAINDGLDKYYELFSHMRRNLELGNTGILRVL